jgi:PAS domain-containing protein
MTLRRLLLVLLPLIATAAFAGGPTVLRLEPYRDTVAIHANVGGRDGFFVFDTGGGVTLLNPSFAEQIGCTPWGRLTGFAMMGNRIDAPQCNDVPVRVGEARLTAPTAGVYDVMTFYPKDAQPVDGLLALNAFDGKAITIDFRAKTLTIETPSSLRKRVAGATEVPVRFAREAQGRALAIAAGVPTSKGRVWMELDSGNSRTILISKPYAALFGLDPDRKEPQPVDFPLAGAIRVRGRASAPDMIIDGNIGMPFLKDTAITIDFAAGRLWVRDYGFSAK